MGRKDYLRLDLSDDALIRDFPISNLKIGLAVDGLFGLIGEIGQGQSSDWPK